MESGLPFLDLELARRINEGIVGLLTRWAPDAQPWPEDHSASEFAEKLKRRDTREVLYLPELAAEPRWPEVFNPDDPNQERVFVRIESKRDHVDYASAVFDGSLVHWEHARAALDGSVAFSTLSPDRHWGLSLEPAETLLREMGMTLIPPAALAVTWGRWTLGELLDPRAGNLYFAGQEVGHLAEAILHTKGVRSPAQAYQRVLVTLRLGYDLGTLSAALDGRSPKSLAELSTWLEERQPPFAWTRPRE